jgi:hypothetical protein
MADVLHKINSMEFNIKLLTQENRSLGQKLDLVLELLQQKSSSSLHFEQQPSGDLSDPMADPFSNDTGPFGNTHGGSGGFGDVGGAGGDSGGFGGGGFGASNFGDASNFKPLFDCPSEPPIDDTDYTVRPEKSNEQEQDNVLYLYESRTGVDIDKEDLAIILDNFDNASDMEDFHTKLTQISIGIKNMNSSKPPLMYQQQLNIMDVLINVRYCKVSGSTTDISSFSTVFSSSLEDRYK